MASPSHTAKNIADLSLKGAVPLVRIRPDEGWFHLDLEAIWQYRELLYFLVWRDIKVRYKQTVIGVGWAIFQPLMAMVLFTVIFSYLAKMPTDGAPYPLFAYAALLPWTFVSQATARSGTSLVGEAQLISKVYFPRLLIPLAAAASPMMDLLFGFLVLLPLMMWYGVSPSWSLLFLPAFILAGLLTALSVSLWLSALNVRYRDVGHVLPFLLQFWMFASPIVYPASLVPERWRLLYSLNPMVGVIEGFRWCLLGYHPPDVAVIAMTLLLILALLVGGLVYFSRMERTFADVI